MSSQIGYSILSDIKWIQQAVLKYSNYPSICNMDNVEVIMNLGGSEGAQEGLEQVLVEMI